MAKTWVIADTHFGHQGVCEFLRQDGSKLRPWSNWEEMDEVLVNNWNSVVKDEDRVYHLGDVCMRRQQLTTLARLKGRKVLVKGNHDIFKIQEYLKYFDDIRAYVVQKDSEGNKVILSHVPIHPDSLNRWGTNIHGHLHSNTIEDERYKCVSVEQTNYFPVLISSVLAERKEHNNNG